MRIVRDADPSMPSATSTTASSVRAGEMIMTVASHGFIDRLPGTERSITLRLRRAQLPDLEKQAAPTTIDPRVGENP